MAAMDYIRITIDTTQHGLETVADTLAALGFEQLEFIESAQAISAFFQTWQSSYDYIGLKPIDSRTPCVRLYLNDDMAAPVKIEKITSAINALKDAVELGSLSITSETVRAEDWQNSWKQYYKPIPIGKRLLIKPSWEEAENPYGRAVVEIESGIAFGTGEHESTKLALRLLEEIVAPGLCAIDIGCGTGILAIAAARLGANEVLAVDIDPMSVKSAKANILLNQLEGVITVVEGDILAGFSAESADIISINIIADVIIRFLKTSGSLVKPGGFVVCSGIINERLNDVLHAAQENAFEVQKTLQMGGWSAVLLKSKAGAFA